MYMATPTLITRTNKIGQPIINANFTICHLAAASAAAFAALSTTSQHFNQHCVSQKKTLRFSGIFSKRLGIFRPNFTLLLQVSIFARLQIFLSNCLSFLRS